MPQGVQALLALLILLPGFVSARIARNISAPSNQTNVERIVEALIFSFFIYVLHLLLFGGTLPVDWSTTPDNPLHYAIHVYQGRLAFLSVSPVLLGVLWGGLRYHDAILSLLRRCRITDRTNDVSVWNGTLRALSGSVQVGLSDGREIVAWLQRYFDSGKERPFFWSRPLGSGRMEVESPFQDLKYSLQINRRSATSCSSVKSPRQQHLRYNLDSRRAFP